MTPPAPKHYWAFDETGGVVAMDSAGGEKLVFDRESFVPAMRGNGLRFNPEDGVRLATTTLPELLPPWTAVFWVKREADSEGAALFSAIGSAVKLEQWPDTHRVGFTRRGHLDDSFDYTAPLGEWVHLALVGTNAEIRLYAGGELKGTIARSTALELQWLGSTEGAADHASMILDEVKIFDQALDAAQLAELRGPPIVVTAAGSAVANGGSLQMGTVMVGGPEVARTFTVTNTGAAPLTVTWIEIDDTTDYSLDHAPLPRDLASGESLTFAVAFSPKRAAMTTATVTLSVGAPGGTYAFALPGTGAAARPEIEVTEGGRPVGKGESIDFGTLELGERAQRTLTLRNAGVKTLRLDAIEQGVDHPNFSMDLPASPLELRAGESTTITVTLSGCKKGSWPDRLTIHSNAHESVFYVKLIGHVGRPRLVVRHEPTGQQIAQGQTVSGAVLHGRYTIPLRIENPGGADLLLDNVQATTDAAYILLGANSANLNDSGETITLPSSLDGSRLWIVTHWEADPSRLEGARISFRTNDRDNPTFTFSVSGFSTSGR